MLDFYIIKDDQTKPSSRKQVLLDFAGELDEVVFENLQIKGIINDRLDYYSDFRLATPLITQIRKNILQKQLQEDSDVKKLLYLFDVAEKRQSGLIAYGD